MSPLVLALTLLAASSETSSAEEAAPDFRTLAQTDFRLNADAAAVPSTISLGLLPQQPPVESSERHELALPPPFGKVGSWRWMINAGGGPGLTDDNFGGAGVGASYFMDDDLSLDFELNLMYFDQEDENAIGMNSSMLLRWHFYNNANRTWSLYADAGAGILVSTVSVPRDGASFNFTPQLGVGTSFDLGVDTRMFLGIRWFHVSNANVFESNPGNNFVMVYAALSFPF